MTSEEYHRLALEALKGMPANPDGTRGYFLTGTMPEFWQWVEFFEVNRMPFRASYCRGKAEAGTYFVALSPMDFDAGFQPRAKRRAPLEKLSDYDRARIVERVVGASRPPRPVRGRYAREDARVEQRPLPDVRPMTEAEAASLAKMLGATAE